MDIFGGWNNYTERIYANWCRIVSPEDTVCIPGDFSWALKLEETKNDFEFLKKLPGKKILFKGNHDLWWSTATKIHNFFDENDFQDVEIVYNNCVIAEGYAIAGTRGWFYDNTGSAKVLMREAGRLEASLKSAKETGLPTLVFLHYPPVYGEYVCKEIIDVLEKYNVKDVYYGHIHGLGFNNAVKSYNNIRFHLLSCDCIDFSPIKIV